MAEAAPVLRPTLGITRATARLTAVARGLRLSIGVSMTGWLAWRNLIHDRIRLIVTLVGVIFSVALMAVQWGLLMGFADTAGALVTHAGGDFWIVSRGTSNVDQSVDISDRHRFQAIGVAGVTAVDKLIVHFAVWRRPDGRAEPVIVVGFNLDTGVGGPWNMIAGSVEDLRSPDAIVLDRIYARKLGVTALGQVIEIAGRRARVVGFTNGIRAFTQSPYVFTSYKNAAAFGGLSRGRTHYLLVRASADADPAVVLQQLRQALPMTDVHTASEFSAMTARYWLLTTGAGAALVLGAALGVIVGVIIVAQTLYAATAERLSEFATLRAIGASNAYLNSIVIKQALIYAAIGSGLGLAVAACVAKAAVETTVSLMLSWRLAVTIGLITLVMCIGASWVAIRKIKTVDPTTVFR